MTKNRKHRTNIYQKRKIWFWIVILAIVVFLLKFLMFNKKPSEAARLVTVGICGCVKQKAVYTLHEGSDLAMLVHLAKGFSLNADVSDVDLNIVLQNDSVYHIPCLGYSSTELRMNYINEVNNIIKKSFRDYKKEVTIAVNQKEIEYYSILYVGMPAVFVLINYYPEFQRINFVHIPHSTMFLNTNYRLIDMFFTLDIEPTKKIVEHALGQKIDYYLIQDRFNFIELINMLGGVELNIDKNYAQEYNLQVGKNKLDGFYAWEYIRFIDWKNLNKQVYSDKDADLVREDNFKISPRSLEMTYEIRNQRQRFVLEGMRKAFNGLHTADQLFVVENFKNVFRTDMRVDFLNKLYKDILTTKHFSFGNIPGYYAHENNNLYFYPDLPKFEMLRKTEIRTYLQQRNHRKQVIY